MKPGVTAAVMLALAATAVFAAENDGWRPEFVKVNKPADFTAAYPPEARDKKLSGEVALDCVAAADGRLVDCKIDSEQPAGLGFGEAALKLVRNERIKTKDAAGNSVAGRPVRSYIPFLAPGDQNPGWLQKPGPSELASVYPVSAAEKGVDGRAIINCTVTVEGFLTKCKVVSEKPEGMGFGSAALLLAPQLRMKPRIRNGKPEASDVNIPINWSELEGAPVSRQLLILDPPWTSTPTSAAVQAAWPAKAKDAKSGQALLRCALSKEGRLRNCRIASEIPAGRGFGQAAMALSAEFAVNFDPEQAKELRDYMVDVPFRFRAPDAPDTRAVVSPRWTRMLTPESAALLYPDAAVEAGVTTGLAVVNCIIDAKGDLSGCEVKREDPAGKGFGEAALIAASKIRMNSWSKEGDPLDGLRVTVPIRLVAPREEAAATPAP